MNERIDEERNSELEQFFTDRISSFASAHLEMLAKKLGLDDIANFQLQFKLFSGSIGGSVDDDHQIIFIEDELGSIYDEFEKALETDIWVVEKKLTIVENVIIFLNSIKDNVEDKLRNSIIEILETLYLEQTAPRGRVVSWFSLLTNIFQTYEKSSRFLPNDIHEEIFQKCFIPVLSPDDLESIFFEIFERHKETITHELVHYFVTVSLKNHPTIKDLISLSEEERSQIHQSINDPERIANRRSQLKDILDNNDKLGIVKEIYNFNRDKTFEILALIPEHLRKKFAFFLQYRAFNENFVRAVTSKFLEGVDQSYGGDYITYFKGLYMYSPAVPGIGKIKNSLNSSDPRDLKKYLEDICERILKHTEELLTIVSKSLN